MTTETTQTAMKMPAQGEGILYVLEDGPNAGELRPGLILKVNGSGGEVTENSPPMTCNLLIFTDFENDGPQYRTGPAWKTAVQFSNTLEPRTWHFPDTVILQDSAVGGSLDRSMALTGGRGGDSGLL